MGEVEWQNYLSSAAVGVVAEAQEVWVCLLEEASSHLLHLCALAEEEDVPLKALSCPFYKALADLSASLPLLPPFVLPLLPLPSLPLFPPSTKVRPIHQYLV